MFGIARLNTLAAAIAQSVVSRSTLTAFGNAQVDTAQFKFGTSALLLDGTGDYVDVTNTTSAGTGDFTLEFWVRWTTVPGLRSAADWQMAFTNPLAATGSYLMLWADSAQIAMGDKYAHFDYGSTVVANTWYHFAVVRQSGDTFLYFNGSKKTFVDDVPGGGQSWLNRSTTLDWIPAAGYRLGAYTTAAKGIIGHMDEIRVSKIARYNANFTPSASAFINDKDTAFLMHCEGADASTVFTDDNSSNSVTSYSFVSATTTTLGTIAWPTIRAGDLAILVDGAGALTTAPTAVTPTGFTNIVNTFLSASTSNRTMVSYKILVGSETGNITGMNGSTNRKNLFIYRPNISINQLTISTPSQQTTLSAPTNQTLTMTGLTGPYIGIAAYMSSGTITSRGSTTVATREVTANSTTNYTKTFEATSSAVSFTTSTISTGDYGTNAMASFTILLR